MMYIGYLYLMLLVVNGTWIFQTYFEVKEQLNVSVEWFGNQINNNRRIDRQMERLKR